MTARFRQIRSAFTLVEVLLALGLFAFCIAALLSILGTSLHTAKGVLDDYQTHILLQNVHNRLQADPLWAELSNTQTLPLNRQGFDPAENEPADIQLRIRRFTSSHWSSPHLETFQIEILDQRGNVMTTSIASRLAE